MKTIEEIKKNAQIEILSIITRDTNGRLEDVENHYNMGLIDFKEKLEQLQGVIQIALKQLKDNNL